MAIFNRLSLLFRANVNDVLDHAEDPEKAIDQAIRDMGSAIQQAEAQVAETIAQKNLTQAHLDDARRLSAEWAAKAELAVRTGADDLAREALRRKKDYDANAEVYAGQLASQTQVVDKLKADLEALEGKYAEVGRNRDVLLARHKTAQAQQKVQQTVAALSGMDPTSELARMGQKIQLEEARASAAAELEGSSLDSRFAALGHDSGVEDELAALKARVAPHELPAGGPAHPPT
jgi:phage shock protein A